MEVKDNETIGLKKYYRKISIALEIIFRGIPVFYNPCGFISDLLPSYI